MRILVINAGSSSLKLRVVGDDEASLGLADLPALEPDDPSSTGAFASAVERLGTVDAAGHRMVHGGTQFRDPVLANSDVVGALATLADLAPLHQPRSIAALEAAMEAAPDIPHVVCFDTAFHATLPDAAATYALPAAWRTRWPIRRFGFHGLSHAWAARRTAELLGRPAERLRVVTAHLGAGASLAAVAAGRAVDTTMGFTPLEGLVMATRAGSVDPGLVLWLLRGGGLHVDEVADTLELRSGLLGLAGTADMREVLAAADEGAPAATLARDVYIHHLRSGIAAMASSMDGLDALVFTGGVGENAPTVRGMAIERLSFLGLAVDAHRNEEGSGDREIGPAGSTPSVLVVESREELEIARQVRAVIGG